MATTGNAARVCVALLTLLAWSCGGTPTATLETPVASGAPSSLAGSPSATSTGSTGVGTPGSPALKLSEPVDGASVPAGNVTLSATIGGPTIVAKMGQPPQPGEGHFIFYLGVDFIPSEAGSPAFTAPGTYAATAQPTYSWPDVPAGKYGVGVQFVNNDDTPYDPPLVARATITVQ